MPRIATLQLLVLQFPALQTLAQRALTLQILALPLRAWPLLPRARLQPRALRQMVLQRPLALHLPALLCCRPQPGR